MRWLLALLVMLVTSPALAFEGEIEAKTFGDPSGNDVKLTIYVSAKRDVRMDNSVAGQNRKPTRMSYIKPATGKYDYMVDHDKKAVIKVQKDAVAGLAKSTPQPEPDKRDIEVKQLGTATIAGQSTRHVQVVDKRDGDTSDFWFSDRYPATMWQTVFSMGGSQGKSPTAEWTQLAARQYGVKPGFIMKMVSKKKGRGAQGLEVTKLAEKKVSTDKFAIPSGYAVTTMPDMPARMPGVKMPTTKEEAEQMRDEWMKQMQKEQER